MERINKENCYGKEVYPASHEKEYFRLHFNVICLCQKVFFSWQNNAAQQCQHYSSRVPGCTTLEGKKKKKQISTFQLKRLNT